MSPLWPASPSPPTKRQSSPLNSPKSSAIWKPSAKSPRALFPRSPPPPNPPSARTSPPPASPSKPPSPTLPPKPTTSSSFPEFSNEPSLRNHRHAPASPALQGDSSARYSQRSLHPDRCPRKNSPRLHLSPSRERPRRC